MRCFVQGGGSEDFSGYNTNTGGYAAQIYSQSRLTRTSSTSYERSFSDGSREVYDFPDSGTTNRRVFLTKIVDPSGNQVRYVYQSTANGTQLAQVIDAIGQTNTFSYGNTNDPLKITTITDPFGRYATLSYAQTNGALRLVSITDPVLIVSQFQYSGNDFISALTTPYGTTTFAYTEGGGTLRLTATDPYGATECLQYREQTSVPVDSTLPAGMLLDTNNLGSRNSYYWGKKAWAQGNNDVSKAVITHWAVQNSQTVDMPLYVKKPLENAVWFNYPGQTLVSGEDITSAQGL